MAENTVKLLWDCGNALSNDTHAKKLLKSHYFNTCRKIAKQKLQLPKENFNVSKMCPRCCSLWSENEFQLKLKPQQIARNAKARKLIDKLEQSKATKKKLLTKKQRRRAKWLQKRVTSSVQIHCDFCRHNTLIPLEKPEKRAKLARNSTSHEQQEDVESNATENIKRKKKKRKNKTAGLRIPQKQVPNVSNTAKQTIVNSKPQKTREIQNNNSKCKKSQATTLCNSKQVKSSTPAVQQNLKTPKASINAILSQPLKAKKQKQKKKQSNQAHPVTQKIQSNTQQTNSLLQLAALLKTQSNNSNSAKNAAQTRLEMLLR